MKVQYRIVNKGKGILNLSPANLHKVGQSDLRGYATIEYVEEELLFKQNQLTAGANISIDVTNPEAPVISATGGIQDLQSVLAAGSYAEVGDNYWEARLEGINPTFDFGLFTTEGSSQISSGDGWVNIYGGSPYVSGYGTDYGNIYIDKDKMDLALRKGPNRNELSFVSPTTNSLVWVPNKSGTLALLSDITDNAADLSSYETIANNDAKLDLKVDKVAGKSLIADTEIARLAGINERFKGKYTSIGNLQTAHPTANAGDYAQVDTGASSPVKNYNWDIEDGWVVGSSTGSTISNTDELVEGTTNLYHTTARVLGTLLTGISTATNRAILVTDSILVAIGILEKKANDNATAIGTKQETLVPGTNIKTVGGQSLLGSGDIPITGGGGDMTTTTDQTVSGIKTFLNGKFGLRNIANTFTSFFANSNTASRTYALQNRDGTLADLADIASLNTNKMNVPIGGIVSYLPKFLTANTMGLSRLFDNGNFFGFGTANAPTKQITLGNQSNQEIGVELSNSTTKGRDLIVGAGTTINYVLNSNFLVEFTPGAQTNWSCMGASRVGNNIYAAGNGSGPIYMQTNGSGNFVNLSQVGREWSGLGNDIINNMYATVNGGDIYKQTNGTGNFVSLAQGNKAWWGVDGHSNGSVYACVYNGDIYKSTDGVTFSPLGGTSRDWQGVRCHPNGDVYAITRSQGVYKQTGGTGSFTAIGSSSRRYDSIAITPNGNIHLGSWGEDIYVLINGALPEIALSAPSGYWGGLTSDANGNIYASIWRGSIYKKTTDALGTPNLDGGTKSERAGAGKGEGKSRWDVWTGQKTASGTDMQVLTKRIEVDETGAFLILTDKIYADNAAAIAGGERPKTIYWTSTGEMRIVI